MSRHASTGPSVVAAMDKDLHLDGSVEVHAGPK
jgi:hypothetical protein